MTRTKSANPPPTSSPNIALFAVAMAMLVPGCATHTGPMRPAPAPASPSAASPAKPPADSVAAEAERLIALLAHDESRDQARDSLIKLGIAATPTLMRHMKDADFSTRWETANVQGYLHDPRAVPALVENVLHDVDSHVRWRSMWALSEYPDRSVAVQLLRVAISSTDPTTRWNGAVGLSMLLVPDCIPILHQGVTDADPWRRFEAINALGRIHNKESVSALAPALDFSDASERGEAAMALGKIGGTEAATLLLRALGDPESGVRWRAVQALAGIADERIRSALFTLRDKERDEMVLTQLDAILGPAVASPRLR